jgi:predicted nucleic acid-binding protein
MRVASEFSMALYDALYVELAVSEGIQLVTTDDHMIRKLEGSRHRSTIVHLRDLGRYA